MAQLIKNPHDFYKVVTLKWLVSKFEPNHSYLNKARACGLLKVPVVQQLLS